MDFISGLPHTSHSFDSIWIIVDRLTKSAHLIFIQMSFSVERLARMYVCEILFLRGLPTSIISNQGLLFTSRFWRTFQEDLGTQVDCSITFSPSDWRAVKVDY